MADSNSKADLRESLNPKQISEMADRMRQPGGKPIQTHDFNPAAISLAADLQQPPSTEQPPARPSSSQQSDSRISGD